MRILHTADLHLGTPLGGHDRSVEHFAMLDRLVSTALEREVDVFLVAGDLFYERLAGQALSRVITGLVERLAPLLRAGIRVVILRGNHDYREHFIMLDACLRFAAAATGDEARVRELVQLVYEPSVIDLPDGLQCVCLPFPTTEWFLRQAKDAHVEADGLVATRNQIVSAAYARVYRQLVAACDPTRPLMVAAHFTVEGAILPGRKEEGFRWNWDTDFIFPISEWSGTQVRYVALGHVHEGQRIPGQLTPIWYPGSPERLNFGERESVKSCLIVEIPENGGTRVEVVELPASDMAVLTCQAADIEEAIEAFPAERRKSAYVKVHVTRSSAEQSRTIKHRLRQAFPKHVGLTVEVESHVGESGLEEVRKEPLALEDFQGTVLGYLRDVFGGDPHAEMLMALAEKEIAHVRGELLAEAEVPAAEGLAVGGVLNAVAGAASDGEPEPLAPSLLLGA